MYVIVDRRELTKRDMISLTLEAPQIARKIVPGQFVVVRVNETGERVPLTVAYRDTATGTITIIFQVVGKSTALLASLGVGDAVKDLCGPLGAPVTFKKIGTVVGIGGGSGIAVLHHLLIGHKEAGNRLIVILGARSKNLLVFENEMRALADELIVCTDDGSYGRKGLVTEPLKELCGGVPKPDMAFVIGPPIMMRACCEATRPFAVKTMVSLNAIMVDGTGMCGGCRVTVGGQTKFTCVDGPEFDGHLVDFDNLMQRLRAYKPQEEESHHKCHLEMEAQRKAGAL